MLVKKLEEQQITEITSKVLFCLEIQLCGHAFNYGVRIRVSTLNLFMKLEVG